MRRRPTVMVFLKEPRPGRVKTRLGRDIGYVAAAAWFRHAALRLIHRLGRDPRWRLVLAVSPDREGLTSRVWPRAYRRWAQGRGDLGDRMLRAMRAIPPGPVVIVGADIPGIGRAEIARALRRLGPNRVVLGPAPDGGYWLIGVANARLALKAGALGDVRWSSPHARADTEASLRPLRVIYADELMDVDTAEDLRRLRPGRPA